MILMEGKTFIPDLGIDLHKSVFEMVPHASKDQPTVERRFSVEVRCWRIICYRQRPLVYSGTKKGDELSMESEIYSSSAREQ